MQAMASVLVFESRSIIIILAAVQHYQEYILWLYSDSENMALALKDTRMTSFLILCQMANEKIWCTSMSAAVDVGCQTTVRHVA